MNGFEESKIIPCRENTFADVLRKVDFALDSILVLHTDLEAWKRLNFARFHHDAIILPVLFEGPVLLRAFELAQGNE